MPVVPTNVFSGPADVFVALFGAAEPVNALAAPGAPWRDVGATAAATVATINQTYFDLVVEQVGMPVGADLTEQAITVSASFAEPTLANLRAALNQVNAGGTNEVQTINLGTASAGSITITFEGQTTGAIAYNAAAATVQTALESLANVDPGDITVTGGPLPGTITLTFGGQYAGTNVAQVTVTPTGLTGGTVTVATTTQGAPGPTLGINGKLLNAAPSYSAVLIRGRKPGGGFRHLILRRALSVEGVPLNAKKGEMTVVPVTFKGFYVSDSVDAFWLDDRQS